MQKINNLLGAHMSISGGVEKSLYRGAEIGCNAIQIFTGSNRQWNLKSFTESEIRAFTQAQSDTGIKNVIAHASYLINLGSANQETLAKSITALEQEIVRCNQLGISYLVLHPGSGLPEQACIDQITRSLTHILEKRDMPVTILLENTAGQGSVVGYTFEQLSQLFYSLKSTKRIGICFDTCHAWAAGYDFSKPASYAHMWEHFDKLIGIDQVKAIHMNDSQKPRGSHVDRHENIGNGTLGLEPFKLLVNDKNFKNIPKILETPKGEEELKQDKVNLDILKNLISHS
jgi:deoxyribonuclease IV